MKKLITALLCSLALTAQARETVTIIYGFSAADSSANYGRNLANEANKLQNKYNFLFDVRPGGGQSIAVNYVKNTPNQILMTSGVFWLRPGLYPDASYNSHEFKTLATMCSAPFAVGSVKFKTWRDVPIDKPITIATSGLGVISHLVAIELQKKYSNATIVPFKSTAEAVTNTLGQQVDIVVGFVGDLEKYANLSDGKTGITILGITGAKPLPKYATLASQGFNSALAKMNTPYNLMIPTSWSDKKTAEVQAILLKVESTKSVRDAYQADSCMPFQVSKNQLDNWWHEQNKYWLGLSVGVKVD